MKNSKKLMGLALTAALSLSLLTACGGKDSVETKTPEASKTPVAEGVKTVEAGKLHMATNAAFPPYEMTTDNGGFEGIDVEVAGKIADKLGLELVVDDMDFSSIITAVQQGKSDIAMAGLTVNEERKQNVDFTTSYATGIQVVIVKDGSDVTIDTLGDGMIGTQEGTTGNIYCSDDYGEDHVVGYTNGATAVQALVAGSVDCVVIDNEPAKAYVAANPGLKILDTEYVTEDYAIGVSKDNGELLKAVNGALEELIADGTVASIVGKYINTEAVQVTTVESGKLHMATNAAFPPYEMTTDAGGFEGIDVEVAGKIAEMLGLELVVDDMDFSSIITAVQQGKSDMAMAGLTVNEERKQNVDFTTSYATGIQAIIVKEGSGVTIDNMGDGMIGTQEGTTGNIYCTDDYGEDHVTGYTNGATAVQALVAGSVDCVVIDNEPAKAYVAANPGLTILDTEYAVEDYAIGVAKTNPDLLQAVNAALETLISDGTVQSIVDKYISAN